MARPGQAAAGAAKEISGRIREGTVLGLGSGSTVAAVLEELAPLARAKKLSLRGVPTSTQIEKVAERLKIALLPFGGSVDLVIDGADQVDSELNMIKGGGGALLKEKVLMASAREVAVVAGEEKFSRRLCEKGVKVPVEVSPIARKSAAAAIAKLGGKPEERLLPKGYPYFTENGNLILDSAFEPLANPAATEEALKGIPGVAEVGIFTIKPLKVYKLRGDGAFERLG
jgi:ribose 5-phosphate isomerase A